MAGSASLSLISIAVLRNTGTVVDTLASNPTGADKLLASLSEQSDDSQPESLVQPGQQKSRRWLLDMRPSVHGQLCASDAGREMGMRRSCGETSGGRWQG